MSRSIAKLHTNLYIAKSVKEQLRILFCLLPIFLSSAISIYAQIVPATNQTDQIRFQRYSIDQGLSQNTIYAIQQDRHGFIWFGTDEGLDRFDGYNFKIYKTTPFEDKTITSNKIYALCEDRNGVLWIGTRLGLNRYDENNDKFISYRHNENNSNSLSNDYILSIFADHNGLIWIGTNGGGLNCFDPATEQFTIYQSDPQNINSVSSNTIRTIYEDRDGTIWIGTNNGLNRFNANTKQFTLFRNNISNSRSLSNNNINAIFEDHSGNFWIATDNGLNKFDRKSQNATAYFHNDDNSNSLNSNNITTINEDRFGNLWIGTNNGLNKLSVNSSEFISYTHDPRSTIGLSSQRISVIYEDRSGSIWFGTYFGGINKYDPLSTRFANYLDDLSNTNNLSKNVWALYEDHNSTVLIGTNNGLIEYDLEDNKQKIYQNEPDNPFSLNNSHIDAITSDLKGNLWVGSNGGGLHKFDRSKGKFIRYAYDFSNPNSISSNNVRAIYADSKGYIWVGTLGGGLNRFDPNTERFIVYKHHPNIANSISGNYARAIIEDNNGNLWVGTETGLNYFDRKTETFTSYRYDVNNRNSISSDFIVYLFIDHLKQLWIGTTGGLNKFNAATKTFDSFNESKGLPNNTINGILEDANGFLWLSTNRGISKFDPDKKSVINYDVHDGLPSSEFNGRACFKGSSGALYFGGNNGFTRFFPEQIKENNYLPPINITSIKLFDIPLAKAQPFLNNEQSNTENKNLVLSYNENFLSFEFAALSYQLQMRNQYSYKMDGIDNDWVNSNTRNYANYSKMQPGEYIFRVRASNSDGLWNNEGIIFKFTITPPFWKTSAAYVAYILLTIGSIYGGVRYRLQSLQTRNLLLETTVQRRTSELAAALSEIQNKNKELIIAKDALEENNQELDNKNQELDNKNQELDEKNQLLDNKNQQLDEKIAALIDSQRQADRIFSALAEALPGTILDGKYRLDERIGSGGFGAVYRSTHLTLQREVAVKVFKPTPGNDSVENLERFKMEAISACRINHPNAVSILDSGISSDGIAYLVMELLKGHTLKFEMLKSGPISIERTIQLIVPVCDALTKAHAMGIVHRDIKPDNIFLHNEQGKEIVKILDFGIAKLMESEHNFGLESITATGKLIGTPVYISPERFAGMNYDGKADVYSLGVILYEMLTGNLPFQNTGASLWSFLEMRMKDPQPLRSFRSDISAEVEEIVMKALAKNVDERLTAAQLNQCLLDTQIINSSKLLNVDTNLLAANLLTNDKNTVADIGNDRWKLVENIFFDLLEKEPAQRSTAIKLACNNDESLEQEVLSLLAAHEEINDDNFISGIIDRSPQSLTPKINKLIETKTNNYLITNKIGDDITGEYYLAKQNNSDDLVTLKLLSHNFNNEAELFSDLTSAIEINKRLSHQNIINIKEAFTTTEENNQIIGLVIEKLKGHNLNQSLQNKKLFSTIETIAIAKQLYEALAFSHEKGIFHCALIADNIWFTEQESYNIKIMNFGFANFFEKYSSKISNTKVPHRSINNGVTKTNSIDKAAKNLVKNSLMTLTSDINVDRAIKSNNIQTNNQQDNNQQLKSNSLDDKLTAYDNLAASKDIYSAGLIIYQMLYGQLPADEQSLPSEKDFIDSTIPANIIKLILNSIKSDPSLRPPSARYCLEILRTC